MVTRKIDCYNGPVTEGIDISEHQGRIQWNQVDGDWDRPNHVRFVIMRLSPGSFDSQGRSLLDSRFEYNWEGVSRRPIWRGVYQAIRKAGQFNGAQHAELCIRTLQRVGYRNDDLPPALDIERLDNLTPEKLVSECLEWVRLIEGELKRRPIIYTGGFWQHKIIGGNPRNPLASVLSDLPLWTPAYQRRCGLVPDAWNQWTIWQYTNEGRAAGIVPKVDRNKFRGNEADTFTAFVRASHIPEGTPSRPSLTIRPVSKETSLAPLFIFGGMAGFMWALSKRRKHA